MPGCIDFKDASLEHEEQLRIMFENITCTNKSTFVPGASNANEAEGDCEGEGKGKGSAAVPKVSKGKRLANNSPKGKKLKKNFRDSCMKRLVDAYEKKAQSSNNSATSVVVDHVRDEIAQLLDVVIQSEAEEGSDEHYFATQLLIIMEYRDVFITLKSPSGRLAWLRRTWEDRRH